MLKKLQLYRQILINLILIMSLVMLQLAFVGELPGMLSDLNLVIVTLLFVLVLSGLRHSIVWAITAGYLLDVLTFQSFGLYLVTLTLTILVAYFLLNSFFTDRSMYSLIVLTFLTTLINEIFWLLIVNLLKLIGLESSISFFNLDFLSNLIAQLVLNVIACVLIFQTVNFISHKLKPVFLIRSKKI